MSLVSSERRQELTAYVDHMLDTARGGVLPRPEESQSVDFKEEAGRRRGAQIEPGEPQNKLAAQRLADEVACFANSPGGGALIVGVEDTTGQVIGTQLDSEWLRHTINRAVDVAPEIVVRTVSGLRVLVLFVAQSPTPVEDTSGRLRWRVSEHCVPVDRSEWWVHQHDSLAVDVMAADSTAAPHDVTAGAWDLITAQMEGADASLGGDELLRRLGVLRPSGTLSQAGRLLLTSAEHSYLELTLLDVPGGNVTNRVVPDLSLSLLEQIDRVEAALNTVNTHVTWKKSFVHEHLRRIPAEAVREAVLNGMIHRDWSRSGPTEVRWFELDSMLEVRSPGGFTGGVTSQNILVNRHARYPALADAFRALGVVEKQGLGVDRMFQAMISLGHRKPAIDEAPGPQVQVTLIGGEPVYPVVEFVRELLPRPRQFDVRISLIVDHLLHHAFINIPSAARTLQTSQFDSEVALRVAEQTTVRGQPLVTPYKGVWQFSAEARQYIQELSRDYGAPHFFPYGATSADVAGGVIKDWLNHHESITTGDVMQLIGVSRGTAHRMLQEPRGIRLTKRGSGRASAYYLGPAGYEPHTEPPSVRGRISGVGSTNKGVAD